MDRTAIRRNRLVKLIDRREYATHLPLPAVERLWQIRRLRSEQGFSREREGFLIPVFGLIQMSQITQRIGIGAYVANACRGRSGHAQDFRRSEKKRLIHGLKPQAQ